MGEIVDSDLAGNAFARGNLFARGSRVAPRVLALPGFKWRLYLVIRFLQPQGAKNAEYVKPRVQFVRSISASTICRGYKRSQASGKGVDAILDMVGGACVARKFGCLADDQR